MNSYELYKKAEEKLLPLHNRMRDDANRAYLAKFTLINPRTGKEVKGAVNITDNSPAVYLNAVSSWIMTSLWQTAVEGDKITPTLKRTVEKFSDVSFLQADDRLAARGKHKVFPFVATHSCLRGWIGARWVWMQDEKTGLVYLDALPMDMRYFSYEQGRDGLNFGGNKTWRSPARLIEEYGKMYPDFKPMGKENIEVVDFLDGEKNEVWVGGKLLHKAKHQIGYPPFVIQAVPEGFMLLDKDYLIHEGESIFFLNRDLYESYSQLFSITQTLALQTLCPPYSKVAEFPQDEPAPYPTAEAAYEVRPGEEYKLIPKPDINTAHQLAYDIIRNAIESGGITNIDLGTQSSPMPPSALLITEQTEIRNKILKPRVETIVNFYELSIRMVIDQFIKGKFNVDLGKPGQRVQYTSDQLGDLDEYFIEYKLMTRNKRQEIANIAISKAAEGELSRYTRLKDVLVCDDPEGEIARLDAEDAEKLDPALKYLRLACSAVDIADTLQGEEADEKRLESMMLTDTGVALIKQRKMTGMPEPETQKPKPVAPLMPLTGQGGKS